VFNPGLNASTVTRLRRHRTSYQRRCTTSQLAAFKARCWQQRPAHERPHADHIGHISWCQERVSTSAAPPHHRYPSPPPPAYWRSAPAARPREESEPGPLDCLGSIRICGEGWHSARS
jgi:hypothetical protein